MPLTKEMQELKKKFEEEYGTPKGDNIFYAWENKHKKKKND